MPFFVVKSKREIGIFAILPPVKNDNKLKLFLASGFLLGLAPVVPGSFGALSGLLWHELAVLCGASDSLTRFWCLLGVFLFSGLHYWLTPWAQAYWRDFDPKHFVLDEVVGYLCVPLFWALPAEPAYPVWAFALLGFVVFRVLDAIKLPVARYIDRNIHSAHGVLFDDVVSAAYSAALVSGFAWMVS